MQHLSPLTKCSQGSWSLGDGGGWLGLPAPRPRLASTSDPTSATPSPGKTLLFCFSLSQTGVSGLAALHLGDTGDNYSLVWSR